MISENYLDAQRAVIGCLIIGNNSIADDIMARVKPCHLADENYRELYNSACRLYMEGKLDQLALQHDSPEYRRLITDIVANTPTAANYKEYMDFLFDEYKLFEANNLLLKMNELIEKGDVTALHAQLSSLYNIFSNEISEKTGDDIGQVFLDFTDNLDAEGDYIGLGFDGTDSRLYLEKGDMVVIGARPSIGKTAFALNIADRISRLYKTVFFSLETSSGKLGARLFSNALSLDFVKIKNRSFSDEEKFEIAKQYPLVKDRKLSFVEASGKTAQEICSMALREKAEVIFVDYLGLVSGEGRADYERVSAISKYFHTFAQKHKVMVVLLSQLNREVTRSSRPDLNNLRDSGQIEQDADAVILLHKPVEEDTVREVIIAKNKEGDTGSFALDFDAAYQRFIKSERADRVLKASRRSPFLPKNENYFENYVQ